MRAIADDTRVNILKEQFIPDHVFIYLLKGAVRIFDGNKNYVFKQGDAVIARKNRLAKYELTDSNEVFEPVLFCFEQSFLEAYQQKHSVPRSTQKTTDGFITIRKSTMISSFIQSIKPYYKGVMQLDDDFEDVKYEELLIILLKQQPELADILFDFGLPQRNDLEKFMNKNYRFNISIDQFATMTGRSISAFKRDFKAIFHETPGKWLVKKRLQEAYFLIDKKNQKPNNIYLDLGFESLSHFSVAFKKEFKYNPTELMIHKK